MAHQDVPFMHERAKASLDSLIVEKWNDDAAAFLQQMIAHKKMSPEPFYVYIQQYVEEPPRPNPLFHPLPSELPSFGDYSRFLELAAPPTASDVSAVAFAELTAALPTAAESLMAHEERVPTAAGGGSRPGSRPLTAGAAVSAAQAAAGSPPPSAGGGVSSGAAAAAAGAGAAGAAAAGGALSAGQSAAAAAASLTAVVGPLAPPLELVPRPMREPQAWEPRTLLNTRETVPLARATAVVRVECRPDTTIGELKRLYYLERIRARKRLAREILYKRLELELGPLRVEAAREQERAERAAAGAGYVDPVETVTAEELEFCCYEWGFFTMQDYEASELQREQRAQAGKFVPARAALTNLRHAGVFLKDFHSLADLGVRSAAHIQHTRRFPSIEDTVVAST